MTSLERTNSFPQNRTHQPEQPKTRRQKGSTVHNNVLTKWSRYFREVKKQKQEVPCKVKEHFNQIRKCSRSQIARGLVELILNKQVAIIERYLHKENQYMIKNFWKTFFV